MSAYDPKRTRTGQFCCGAFEGGGSRPGKQSHVAAGIHIRLFGGTVVAWPLTARAAGGDAGDRIPQQRRRIATNEIVCPDFVTHSNGIAAVVVRFVPLVLLRVSQNLRPSA